MSGPKSAEYTLTAAQRAILAEQERIRRQKEEEEMRRKQEAAEEKRLCGAVRDMLLRMQKTCEDIAPIVKESGRGREEQAAAKHTMQKLQNLLDTSFDSTLPVLQNRNATLRKALSSAEADLQRTEQANSNLRASFTEEVNAGIRKGFLANFGTTAKKKKPQETPIDISAPLCALREYTLSQTLSERLEELLISIKDLTTNDQRRNFLQVVVQPFVKQCEEYEANRKTCEELYIRYAVLATQNGETAPCYAASEAEAVRMQNEITRLEKALAAEREKEYIDRTLDEVMREMGYSLLGDRTHVAKHSGKKAKHLLYQLASGTAVDVTYSENGQIAMELGALDDTDRTPTSEEAQQLEDDMQSFCSDYAQFARKLSERGILTRNISMLPPSAQYAQIFNTKEYTLHKHVEKYTAARRVKREDKVLHND